MAGACQGEQLVEELVCGSDHLGPPPLVVARGQLVVLRQRVGAVQRIEEGSPAGVGRVQRVARHGGGHHKLRSGDQRDLRVNAVHLDIHVGGGRHQVADVGQEPLVVGNFRRTTGKVPSVQCRLEGIAAVQQPLQRSFEGSLQPGQPLPPDLGLKAQPRQQFLGHEGRQVPVDLQSCDRDRHVVLLSANPS